MADVGRPPAEPTLGAARTPPEARARRRPRVLATVIACLTLLGGAVVTRHSSDGPVHDLPGWDLVLVQDFDTDAELGDFATRYPGWAGYDGATDTSRDYGRPSGSRGRYDSRTTATVADGVLDVHVHTRDGTPQVMALTPTTDGEWWDGRLHGRYSVRFRADRVPGYKVAWLLWPTSDDWTEGEVDFPEGDLGEDIDGNAHDVTGDPAENAWSIETGTSMQEWHTATIEWAPGRLTFQLDDREWTTTDPRAVPVDPMRWVLQTETQLSDLPPDPGAAGHVQIDWVAVWAPA